MLLKSTDLSNEPAADEAEKKQEAPQRSSENNSNLPNSFHTNSTAED
jgi:hypothetical protein